MSYLSQLAARRQSIRKYSSEEIDPDLLTDIVEAALMAPTSRNSQSVRLIVVDDRETVEALSGIRKHGSSFVAGASVVIAVCADTSLTRRPLADSAIAATYLQLGATSNDLASCWCHVEDSEGAIDATAQETVHRLLDLPESLLCHCLIALGLPEDKSALEPKERDLAWEHVYVGKYDPTRGTVEEEDEEGEEENEEQDQEA